MLRHLRLIGVFLLVLGLAGSAWAQSFSNVVVFGDSLDDSGNAAAGPGLPLPPGTGFTTNPDPVRAEIVAEAYGASGAYSLAGGTNYAFAGACMNPATSCNQDAAPTLTEQIEMHLAAGGGSFDPNALYTIRGGLNDIVDTAPSNPSTALGHVIAAADVNAARVRRLSEAGARHDVEFNIPDTSMALFAVAVASAGEAVRAADGGKRSYYEIAADGETRERGGAGRIEFDAAFPIGLESRRNSALFLQPGAVLSQGPDGRALHGASLGIVFRFEAGGGIVGLNAFHDLNRISGSGRDRTHRQASLGADYQIGRSRIGANYYIPLTGRRGWESGQARLTEYAVGGPELRYRLALDDRWTLSGRAFRETGRGGWRGEGSGAGNGWRLAVGASYRLGCARLGLDIERDTRRGETAARLGLTFRLGAAAGRCAGEGKPDLLALVEREKIVAVRQAAVPRLVPLTSLPEDVTRLYDTVTGGDPDADTVWLFSQGGPVTELDSGSDLTEFPGHEKRILVNVHQVQTLNPGLIDDARLDSVARVQAEMDVSVEILDRVIRHFKARGKRVVVFSHSFGSFIVPRYLALKGPGAADRYVIMAGRLDIERKMYENRLSKLHDGSTVAYYYEGGTTLTRLDLADDPDAPLRNGMLPRWLRMQAAFQGALGKHRYTRLLASKDLSKVIYAYGTMDQAIGRLTGEEVAFLESRGAEVLAVEGGHGSMFAEPAAARIVELLEDLGRGPALFEGRGEACSRPCRRAVPERTAVRARVPEKAPSVR